MARFVFKLEPALRLRQRREDERQRETSMIQGELSRLKSTLLELDESVKAANETMRQKHLTGRIDLSMLAAHRRFLGASQQRAREILGAMEKVGQRLESSRRLLAAASKDRKILEKLKEKQQLAWADHLLRKEATELDEVAMKLAYAEMRQDGEGEEGSEAP